MSPTIVAFFETAFYQTRYTKQIKNLDWKLGVSLKVFGRMSSIVTEENTSR